MTSALPEGGCWDLAGLMLRLSQGPREPDVGQQPLKSGWQTEVLAPFIPLPVFVRPMSCKRFFVCLFFSMFKWLKKIPKESSYFGTQENDMQFESQCPAIKLERDTATPTCPVQVVSVLWNDSVCIAARGQPWKTCWWMGVAVLRPKLSPSHGLPPPAAHQRPQGPGGHLATFSSHNKRVSFPLVFQCQVPQIIYVRPC